MDGRQFDAWAKLFATTASRRRLLGLVVGGLGGILVPWHGNRAADAACPPGQTDCGGTCVSLGSDHNNCGSCGNVCGPSQNCMGGSCWDSPGPGPGPVQCGGPTTGLNCMAGLYCCYNPLRCVDLQTSSKDCGSCGNTCTGGAQCVNGFCALQACLLPNVWCGNQCVDLQTDPNNCGSCGNVCTGGAQCVNGFCALQACLLPNVWCGNQCVDLQSDANNCGSCGNACGPNQNCVQGVCSTPTPACVQPNVWCGNVCVDLQTDPANCGACGHACGAGQGCVNGQCVGGPGGCPAGLTDCNGVCVDLASDPNNCGACGLPCAHQGGWGLCCGGICVDHLTDPNNCGACGTACPSGRACVNGVCEGGAPPSAEPTPPSEEPTPASPPPGATEKWALWQEEPRLRGAHLLQRRAGRRGDPAVLGEGPVGPVYTIDDLARLVDLGANYVEVVHPVPVTETPPYKPYGKLRDNLDRLVDLAASVGLWVVIGYRSGPGRSEDSLAHQLPCQAGGCFAPATEPAASEAPFWRDPAAHAAWADAWRTTAERYRDHPAVIGYDLLVNPDPPEPAVWYELAAGLIEAVRTADAATPVLVTLPGNPPEVGAWRPGPDERTVYRASLFAPERFQVQPLDAPAPLVYPGDFDPARDAWEGGFNRLWLQEVLVGPLAEVRARSRVPVAVQAFGVPRWQPGAAPYLEDLTSLFDEAGMNAALWLHYPAAWPPVDDAYDLERGPDPANHEPIPNDLHEVIRAYWRRNEARPERD